MTEIDYQRLSDYLNHITQYGDRAISYCERISEAAFFSDDKTQAAVCYCLVVTGEAASRINRHYPDFVKRHDDFPWSNLISMRNFMAHGYDAVDFKILWDTVTDKMPDTLAMIPRLLESVAAINPKTTSP